jgi:transposase-like protein
MPSKTRKHYSPAEKITILRKHLIERIAVSELCEQYRLQPTIFYRWQRQFFEEGESIFSGAMKNKPAEHEQKVAALEEKLVRKNEVVAELMEELIKLKKR